MSLDIIYIYIYIPMISHENHEENIHSINKKA